MDGDDIRGAVHTNMRHDSAVKHVTGRAVYIDDMPVPPNCQETALVLSPYASARIVSIDTSEAAGMPGVSAVISAKDIPGINDIAPVFADEPMLADATADYAGMPVAAVAADTYDQALAAAKRIKIEYEELEPVLSIEEAWEKGLFTYTPPKIVFGDAEDAIEKSPNTVFGDVSCGGQDHFYLESHIALALPGEDSDVTVYSSTQHPTEVQHGVSHVLGVAQNDVTVEVRRMGGGFGGKESQSTIVAGIAALLAVKCHKPVKLRLRRDDDMIATGKRHDFLFKYRMGFDDTGRIDSAIIDMAARSGNVADLSAGVVARALCHGNNAYYIPNVLFRGWPCKTNTVSNTAFRGFGGPQGMIAIETAIEHIARELGKTVEDVRAVNWMGTTDRNVMPYGQTVTENIMPEIADRLAREIDLDGRKKAIDEFNASHTTLKKGIALMPVTFGISFNAPVLNQAGALVHVYTDGSVHLNHGGTEMGQGLFTKVAQVVSSVFQIDIDHVKISATRTDKVPNTGPTAASAGSDLNGMAAFNAADEIRQRMAGVVAGHFGVPEDEIEFRQNRVYAGNESLSFAQAAEKTWLERVSLSATGYYKTPDIHWDAETMTGSPFYYFTFGASVSEVVIDTLTGESRVLTTDILQDVGSSLNPSIDLGQIEGAFVQGMGWVTSEELVWDPKGRLMTHGPSTYKIPGSRDVPPHFKVHILEDVPNPVPTIYRSKAVGEPPVMLAISVWLALRDAVSRTGAPKLMPKLDAPATPEAILIALEDLKQRSAA
ncbi:MAG: xanthine dehydrogenase molybdopterin binding subunit [Alphaproteobacteria bacterium]|nr:xanthine dehydrogenase molybdopterin binding subunit [Alphaproteobacteria bacterium]